MPEQGIVFASEWRGEQCHLCKPVRRVMARTLFSRTAIGVCRGRRDLNSLRFPWRYWELHRGQAERCGAVISTAIERKRTLCGESATDAETHLRTIFTATGIQRRSRSRVVWSKLNDYRMYKCASGTARRRRVSSQSLVSGDAPCGEVLRSQRNVRR
jgi:hypothetical protein